MKGALGHHRLPSGKLALDHMKEQRCAGNAQLPGPLPILPAQRIEQRLFDTILIEKREAKLLCDPRAQRGLPRAGRPRDQDQQWSWHSNLLDTSAVLQHHGSMRSVWRRDIGQSAMNDV